MTGLADPSDRFVPSRITDRLLQNGYISTKEALRLRELGVTHILNLDLPYDATRVSFVGLELRVFELLLHDMAPLSEADARRVIAVMQRALDIDHGVLYVHCNAGLSRSPTAAWLYLVASAGEDEAAARARIAGAARHLDAPDPILVSELDVPALRAWSRTPRHEVWRASDRTHPELLAVFADRASAAADMARREEKLREFTARRRVAQTITVRHWLDEAWTDRPQSDGKEK